MWSKIIKLAPQAKKIVFSHEKRRKNHVVEEKRANESVEETFVEENFKKMVVEEKFVEDILDMLTCGRKLCGRKKRGSF